MTEKSKQNAQAAARMRRKYERDKAAGLVKVCVTIPADRRAELMAFAAKLKG